jgi:acyl dehydratase
VGGEVEGRTVTFTRQDLVRYAWASGDFNPIHYSDRAATAAGLPGVIAHGMLTMGSAIDVVTAWAGDPGVVLDYEVRFSRPVPVPDLGGANVEVAGTVVAVDEAAGRAGIVLSATSGGVKVLGKAKVTVRLTPGPRPLP